jgi:cytochrome P450
MPETASVIPNHIAPDQVFFFDVYKDEQAKHDLHAGLFRLHAEAPDFFYTPANGGHWVATRYDLIADIVKDNERFSTVQTGVPKQEKPVILIPLHLDPPEHTPYRKILMRYFSAKAVASLESKVRAWARRLIDAVAGHGECDFVPALGVALPVSVFMEMMGLPFDRFADFRALVVEFFSNPPPDRYAELTGLILTEMRAQIALHRRQSTDDLIGQLVAEEVDGRLLTPEELESICFLLLVAGLDTVANAAAFAFRYLATVPALQAQLAAGREDAAKFVEEAFRMFGVVNTSRVVKHDMSYAGAQLRAGDMVLCMLPLAGLDERRNASPLEFQLGRNNRSHMLFSNGAHLCVGHILAKLEMRVMVEEWLQRIPRFWTASGYIPNYRPGGVMALENLSLQWPAPTERPTAG